MGQCLARFPQQKSNLNSKSPTRPDPDSRTSSVTELDFVLGERRRFPLICLKRKAHNFIFAFFGLKGSLLGTIKES